MDLPFNKIIIDSRHAAAGNSSNFQISLPETLTLPQHAVCYVCDLQITNTFSSTDPSKNTFYWIENELNQYVLNRVFNKKTIHTRHSCDGIADQNERNQHIPANPGLCCDI